MLIGPSNGIPIIFAQMEVRHERRRASRRFRRDPAAYLAALEERCL
jgi:hypothetical protein